MRLPMDFDLERESANDPEVVPRNSGKKGYSTPRLHCLSVSETEGKTIVYPVETTIFVGPS